MNDLRRFSLRMLLIGLSVGLVVIAVVSVLAAAVGIIHRLAQEQALIRVRLAAANVLQMINRAGEDTLTAARLLAERPTLAHLLQQRDARSLSLFLERFQHTSELAGCAVLLDDRILARSGAAIPWSDLRMTQSADRQRFLTPIHGASTLLLGAWSAVPSQPDATVWVGLLLDRARAAALGEQVGLRTAIRAPPRHPDRETAPIARLQAQALMTEEPASARLEASGVFGAAIPLFAPSGKLVGTVTTVLPVGEVDRSVQKFIRRLVWISIGVGALAIGLSLIVAQRLGRPVQILTRAAERIGAGDWTTPIPRSGAAEIGALATTMEEMRRHLVELTADLRRRQAETEAILGGIVEGVFAVDRDRRVRYLNPQAAQLLGLDPTAALGRFCGDLLDPQGPGGARPCEDDCPILHARFRGGARATELLRLRDGRRRSVVITSAPLAEERQVQLMRDETEQEATRRLRDTVLANISHEFKTPLTAQLASIELLRERLAELADADRAEQLVAALERGTLRLTQLIDNLLESVRIEAGRDSMRRQRLALDEVIEEAVALTAPLIRQRDQELKIDLPYPLPPLWGDATRLTQVFVNLLANANKFAPPASAISIGGEVEARGVTLWVEDQGPGLPADLELFERFVRGSGAEPEQSGMGLGLWLVKSIVERHGGRVEARRMSGGTRMCVSLPREPNDEDPGG